MALFDHVIMTPGIFKSSYITIILLIVNKDIIIFVTAELFLAAKICGNPCRVEDFCYDRSAATTRSPAKIRWIVWAAVLSGDFPIYHHLTWVAALQIPYQII